MFTETNKRPSPTSETFIRVRFHANKTHLSFPSPPYPPPRIRFSTYWLFQCGSFVVVFLCLYVCGFICGACFVLSCSPSLLLMPEEGYASWLWYCLGISTCLFGIGRSEFPVTIRHQVDFPAARSVYFIITNHYKTSVNNWMLILSHQSLFQDSWHFLVLLLAVTLFYTWAASSGNVPSAMSHSEDSDQPAHSRSLIRISSERISDGQGCQVSSCGQRRL